MTVTSALQVVAGALIIIVALYDIFRTAVLPRPAVGRFSFSRVMSRRMWALWRTTGGLIGKTSTREAWLASFGPVVVFAMFAVWAITLLLGYALLYEGLAPGLRPAPQAFGDSLYFSATTFVPLSYGDVLPLSAAARIVTVAETASGIILTALVITLLFSLYQSFQQRETLVVTLDAMAGAPAAGVQILETAGERGMRAELIRMFDDWRQWSATVLESHLAFPMLLYFRSSHDNEAWLNSLAAVMDAAALVLSTVEDQSEGAAHLMFVVGMHLVDDMTSVFRLRRADEPFVERGEFDDAVARLQRAGFTCRQGDAAWSEFTRLRAGYASQLNELAKWLAIAPAQWIGDRSYLPHQKPRRRRR